MLTERANRRTLDIHGRQDKVRMIDCVARVHAAWDRPLRIVAVEPLTGGRGLQAFYLTRYDASGEQVLTAYAMRWSIEVAFQSSKTHLGFEEPQGWTRRGANGAHRDRKRTPPYRAAGLRRSDSNSARSVHCSVCGHLSRHSLHPGATAFPGVALVFRVQRVRRGRPARGARHMLARTHGIRGMRVYLARTA